MNIIKLLWYGREENPDPYKNMVSAMQIQNRMDSVILENAMALKELRRQYMTQEITPRHFAKLTIKRYARINYETLCAERKMKALMGLLSKESKA